MAMCLGRGDGYQTRQVTMSTAEMRTTGPSPPSVMLSTEIGARVPGVTLTTVGPDGNEAQLLSCPNSPPDMITAPLLQICLER